ncbi:MAG: ATP-binding protein [Desulfosudaceae bacterium]
MIPRNTLALFLPRFLNPRKSRPANTYLFNYKKVWLISFVLMIIVCLLPLTIFLIVNSRLSHKAIENESHLHTLRLTSNARRTATYFFEERMDALQYIIQNEDYQTLTSQEKLTSILENLKMGFGGFLDLGVITSNGVQVNYAGPFDLAGKQYSDQKWFKNCVEQGFYLSDVFMGYRQEPHMIVAVKSPAGNDDFYILRATLDIQRVIHIFSSLELVKKSDAFICNRQGRLQTPSKYYGDVLDKIDLAVPPYSSQSRVYEATDTDGKPILIGYAYLENSPYILMVIKRSREVMKGWYELQQEMIWFYLASALTVFIVILCIVTFMVNKIYDADQTRLKAMERLEGSSRLISIGRLAAGVAHEINNPLAVINENAGLIRDMFSLKQEYQDDPRLLELIDDVLESVARCGAITKQLLGFARHFKPSIHPVDLKQTIQQVLSFFRKEASYRGISVNVDIPDDLPTIHSDSGSLQQVFFNLINNAFQAINEKEQEQGTITITASLTDEEHVAVKVKDSGCGISEEGQKKIFEPFFTTKSMNGGTGLGLSIIYGILKKLNGDITVRSKVDKGTTFTVILPINLEGEIQSESSAG